MPALINIIHPHMYRCVPDDGIDYKVVDFLKKELDKGSRMYGHFEIRDNVLGAFMRKATMEMDAVFGEIFMDKRVESFFTLGNGYPFPDKMPKDENEEQWKALRRYFVTHSELKTKINGYSPIIFLGGAFERCVGNIAAYCADNYELNNGEIFCIEDLSVSVNKEEAGKMKDELRKRGVQVINSQEALKQSQ